MKRYAPLLLLFLSFLATALAEPFRLQTEARPTQQEVFLKVDCTQDSFSGRTRIELKLPEGAPRIQFHALDIKVSKANLSDGDNSWPLEIKVGENAIITATAEPSVKAGEYTLELEFAGPFNRTSQGLYKYFDSEVAYLSTQFEMTDARRCFPCFDEPCYKIPFQLTVESPTDQKVYSNTPEKKTTEKDGWTTHEFASTPPIPSYLVALAVGPYQEMPVERLSVPGRIISPAGQLDRAKYAATNTPQILAALEDYFGIPYPYAKLDQVGVSEFPYGAMENAGLVTYRADIVLIDESTASVSERERSVAIIAHEFAHQWFGNLVTMKWWDDLWLNEAFATWMGNKVIARLYPELEADLYPRQNWVMSGDAHVTTRPIRKPIRNENDILDGLGLAYNKGSSALLMVEKWIGQDTFRDGVRRYLQAHKFANAEAADLWNALGKASGKDVKSVLGTFTEYPGYPLISFEVAGSTLHISQTRYLLSGVDGPNHTWTLPLFLHFGAGGKETRKTILLDQPSMSVELDYEPEWLYPDDGAVGYFRWNEPESGLNALFANRGKLSDREQLATLYNLQALERAGKITVGQRLAFNNLFLNDDHPAVVALALAFLEETGRLYVTDENREQWEALLSRLLRPVADRYGLEPRDEEHPKVQELRALLWRLLAQEIKDQKVIASAQDEASRYISTGQTTYPVLVPTYLYIAARNGDVEMVRSVKEAILQAKNADRRSKLMSTLGEFGQPEAQKAALDLLLDDAVTAADLRYLLSDNADEEPRRRRLHAWIEANYEALSQKIPSAFLAFIPSASARADNREGLEEALKFYRAQPDPQGTLERELSKVEERALSRIQARERGQAAFDAYLKEKS